MPSPLPHRGLAHKIGATQVCSGPPHVAPATMLAKTARQRQFTGMAPGGASAGGATRWRKRVRNICARNAVRVRLLSNFPAAPRARRDLREARRPARAGGYGDVRANTRAMAPPVRRRLQSPRRAPRAPAWTDREARGPTRAGGFRGERERASSRGFNRGRPRPWARPNRRHAGRRARPRGGPEVPHRLGVPGDGPVRAGPRQ